MRPAAQSRCLAAFLGVAAGLGPAIALGQPSETPTTRLEWTALPRCISRADLAAAVSRELGRAAFVSDDDAELVARARVLPTPDGRFRAEVSLFTADGLALGVRELESDTRDCRALDDPLAVVFAAVLSVRRAEIEAIKAEHSRWTFRVGARGGAILGLLPNLGIEAGIHAGFAWDRAVLFALELGYDWTDSAVAREGSLTANAATARLLVAPVLVGGDPEITLRLAAGAGPMWASAAGFPQVATKTRLLVEARAGLGFAVHATGMLWVEMTGDVGVAPVRPRFVVANADGSTQTLFEAPWILGNIMVGFSVRAE